MSFERLDELARQEEAAVENRSWEELIAIQREQLDVLESFPDRLPREALAVLEHALARCRGTQQALFSSLAETKGVIERMRTGRQAIGAYRTNRRGKLDARV